MPTPLSSDIWDEIINVADLSSGRVQQYAGLTAHMVAGATLLSPDHEKLARVTSLSEIDVISLSSGDTNRLTLPGAASGLPPKVSWAPDSLHIAVATQANISIVDTSTATTSVVASTTEPMVGIGAIAWSPDGKWIAYADGFFLARVRPDGSEQLRGPAYYGGPKNLVWSPSSNLLAFDALLLEPSPVDHIFVSDSSLRVHSVTTGGVQASWSTSGDRLAYLFPMVAGESVLIANADGSGQHTLATVSQTTVALDEPTAWSPDDHWITAAADGSLHLISLITGSHVIAVQPPPPVQLNNGRYARCNVFLLGWVSHHEIMTLMRCVNSL